MSEEKHMLDEKQDTKGQKMKGGKLVIIGGGVLAAAVVALSVVVVQLVRQKDAEPQESEAVKRNVVITQDNAEEVIESMAGQSYVPLGHYIVSMSTTWHFATGDAISEDAYVENDAGNTNDVYFDVFLEEDENTPILQSPVIPRGAEFENISLDQPLEAGSYNCVMIYHLVDSDQNTVSTLRIGFTIEVEQ